MLHATLSPAPYVVTGASPSPWPSQKQDAVSGEHGPSTIVAAVESPRFLKRDDVCLGYPLSLSLRLAKYLSLLSVAGVELGCSAHHDFT